MFSKVKIIAEVGVNHNGSITRAKKLIDIAKDAGADFVKFQSYVTENLLNQYEPLMRYQKFNIKRKINQFEMLKNFELNFFNQNQIKKYCKEKKIRFLSTPYDMDSVKNLIKMNLQLFKIGSSDCNNVLMINYLLNRNKKIILSTGCVNEKELKNILNKINYKKYRNKIILMHCTSFYPAPVNTLNLSVINSYSKKFKLIPGYSDHSSSLITGALAVQFGAKFIEKHITLDKKDFGPDHKASLEPKEFREYINNIRFAEKAFGNPKKKIMNLEKPIKRKMQKSIYTTNELKKGAILKENMLTLKRPNDGISALNIFKIINRKINKNLKNNHKISFKDLY